MASDVDIYDRLTPIFRSILRRDDLILTPQLAASDVDTWDSLAQINLIVSLEDEFGIEFTTQEHMAMKSVGDLVDILRGRTAQGDRRPGR